MSHALAAQCAVCGVVDDPICPECGTPSSDTHGTTTQHPWRHVGSGGYVHQWHPGCLSDGGAR